MDTVSRYREIGERARRLAQAGAMREAVRHSKGHLVQAARLLEIPKQNMRREAKRVGVDLDVELAKLPRR